MQSLHERDEIENLISYCYFFGFPEMPQPVNSYTVVIYQSGVFTGGRFDVPGHAIKGQPTL
jgi:hypothetical protein